jgi:hypothetical protein
MAGAPRTTMSLMALAVAAAEVQTTKRVSAGSTR